MNYPAEFPVRFSRLKLMARAPSIYRHNLLTEREDTDDMAFGRAVHSLVLGGARVVEYEGRRDDRIEAWREFKSQHAGSEILRTSDYERAIACANAVLRCERARRWLEGQRELDVSWNIGPRKCSSRIDVLGGSSKVWTSGPTAWFITDLKTTRNASPEWFLREAQRQAYHAQLAWYVEAAGHMFGMLPGELAAGGCRCMLVAVESRAPFPVTVVEVKPSAREAGWKLCRLWFERLLVCEESDYWPDYSEGIVDMHIDESDSEFKITVDGAEVEI